MASSRVFRGTDEAEAARRAHEATLAAPRQRVSLDKEELRELCLNAGADDVGFVELDRETLGIESDNAKRLFARTETLVCFVCATNPDAIRSESRAVANIGWHQAHEDSERATAKIIKKLRALGVGVVETAIGFPMEARPEPGTQPWEISHKVVAIEAGLGHMGVHRNVIHPKFGSFVVISTLLIDAPLGSYDHPIDYNPCNDCNLCVVACPVGAVRANDDFDFFACMNHNYREFLFGFEDWIHSIAASDDKHAYVSKFPYEETRSFWQSLAFGPNYKAAYCQAVCPAGDDIIGPYMDDRVAWREEVVVPLREKRESVYVQSGSRAERVARRNPNKRVRYVDYQVDVSSPHNFKIGLQHRFDDRLAVGVTCTIRFRFPDGAEFTSTIADGTLDVESARPPEATVTLSGDDYIKLLHPSLSPIESHESRHHIAGDARALGALLACLV